jgi:hypothetical protein
VGVWDDLKKVGGYAVEGATLGAYNPNTGGGWAGGLINPILNGGNTASTQPLETAQKNSLGLQQQFGGLASAFKGAYDPNQVSTLNTQQGMNIAQLQAQANGTAPSAAEMQLKQQGANNAAGAYGLAAALGARSPGAALDSAQRTAQQTQANTNAQAAQLRAQEQASGQSALAQALGGMQQQQQGLRSQDLGYLQGLYGNQLGASGQVASAAGAQVNANATNAASKNSFIGGLAGGAGSAIAASDRREKTDVKPASGEAFDKLADALKGFGFEYKHPGTVPGEAPGPRVGVMAQDALKGGPAGKAMVDQGNDGVLRLDTGNALGAALAMSAEALRRTRGGARGGRLSDALKAA